jgi:hypothetical protein
MVALDIGEEHVEPEAVGLRPQTLAVLPELVPVVTEVIEACPRRLMGSRVNPSSDPRYVSTASRT